MKANDSYHAIYAGDPVVLVSGNTVARIPAVATAAALPILGVVRHVLNGDGRPLTHNLPGTPNRIPVSTAGWVDVNEDPHQTYLVNTTSTVTSTHIGQYVETTAATPNTAAGRSGMTIELSGAANTADESTPFQIIGIGANNLDGIVGGEANHDVEVRIAHHVFGQVIFRQETSGVSTPIVR